jgi:hypothetical protein
LVTVATSGLQSMPQVSEKFFLEGQLLLSRSSILFDIVIHFADESFKCVMVCC